MGHVVEHLKCFVKLIFLTNFAITFIYIYAIYMFDKFIIM
jgi:hypothetical protein